MSVGTNVARFFPPVCACVFVCVVGVGGGGKDKEGMLA